MTLRPSARLALAGSAGFALSLLSTLPAAAHGSGGDAALGGVLHPLLGLDHLLLLWSVGLAAQAIGPVLLWGALAGALLGSGFGLAGGQLPLAELLAALAVSATGLLLLQARSPRAWPPIAAAALVGSGMAVHGLLHAQEANASTAWWLGALTSSALVVGVGLASGRVLGANRLKAVAAALGLTGLALAALPALG
ncbi:MAG: HupE/UreJ family protein [Prochlorococcaceae cyanobacterium]